MGVSLLPQLQQHLLLIYRPICGGGGVEGGWRVWGKFGGNKYLIAQRALFGFPENIERWYLPE